MRKLRQNDVQTAIEWPSGLGLKCKHIVRKLERNLQEGASMATRASNERPERSQERGTKAVVESPCRRESASSGTRRGCIATSCDRPHCDHRATWRRPRSLLCALFDGCLSDTQVRRLRYRFVIPVTLRQISQELLRCKPAKPARASCPRSSCPGQKHTTHSSRLQFLPHLINP